MVKLNDFNLISNMDEETKNQYIKIIHKNALVESMSFIASNIEFVREKLTRSQREILDKTYSNKSKMSEVFLKKIIEFFDEERYIKFNKKIIKGFVDDKELLDSMSKKMEYDEIKLAEYFVKSEKKKDSIIKFFECLGTKISISEESLAVANNSIEIENLRKKISEKEEKLEEREKELLKKNQELDDQKKKQNEEKKNYESSLEYVKNELNKQIKEQSETIKKLEKELEERPKEVINVNESNNDQEVSDESFPKIDNKIRIDFQDLKKDLEERTLLGVVRAEGIQIDNKWIIVTPIVPIINDNPNINKDEFMKLVDYRSDYSTFILLIDDVLDMCLSEEEAYNYQYYNKDEKFSCLFKAVCKKILFFTPKFVELRGEFKLKLNAKLLSKPIDYAEYNNLRFVPRYNSTVKAFEEKIKNHEDLILENYPASLSSHLKYILVKETIYEVNYFPSNEKVDGRYIKWKFKAQEDKPVFKKLDIKINNSVDEKYILAPSRYSNDKNVYIKNVVFIQSSMKKDSLFDEKDFINRISSNAKSKNLFYEESDLKNFHVAVKSSNLVILAGPSGIGKTRLPLVYANTLGLDIARNTVLFVPISPSYLEPEDVLGYIRPLAENEYNAEYIESNTGLVNFLIDASEHKDKMHFVIFDEMNLSQIEHWFAPFISLLEQDPDSRILSLYSDNLKVKNSEKYPSSILIGDNVFFIGTVNIDETTKQISDRLLDRAIVINLAAPSFENLKNIEESNVEIYNETSFDYFSTSVEKIGNATKEFNDKEFNFINELNNILINSIYNKGISFRSLTKMALYLRNSNTILSREEAFDFIVLQSVIRRINGSREELENIISDDETNGILKIINNYSNVSGFERTRKVIIQKAKEINKYGFTR